MSGQGGPRRGRWVVALAALAVLLGACGGGDDDEALPPPPSIAEPTTVPPDPYAVPAVIDAAYVNRVLEGLDAAMGEVVRIMVRSRDLSPEALERLTTMYADPSTLQLKRNILTEELNKNLEGYRPNPGNQRTTVIDLVSAARDCIFARVSRDYSQVVVAPTAPSTLWVGLKHIAGVDRAHNPTNWAMTREGFRPDGSAPSDPCSDAE